MPYVNTHLLLQTASRAGYCVGAFNIVDYLTLEAVVRAAEERRSPVIIQTSSGTVRRFGPERLVAWTCSLAEASPIPVGLHLDHGTDPDLIAACIRAGYSSVMIDASAYPFAENVSRTRAVVEQAHARGISVEGEIGVTAGVEDEIVIHQDQAIYTTAEEAIAFQAQSGVDFLAVAIGTAHGFYLQAPRLEISTLRQIRVKVDFPLVVHGGSGLDDPTVQALVAAGMAKMNISTQLKKTYIDGLYAYIDAFRTEYNPTKLLDHAGAQLIAMIGTYMDLLGSCGRAPEGESWA